MVTVFALTAGVLFAVSLPLAYAARMRICTGSCTGNVMTATEVARLDALGLSHSDYVLTGLVLVTVAAVACLTVAGVLLAIAGSRRDALVAAAVLVALGVVFAQTLPALAEAVPALGWVVGAFEVAANTVFFVWLLTFPDGRFTPRWGISIVAALVGADLAARAGWGLPGAAEAAGSAVVLGLTVTLVVRRLRRLPVDERRRAGLVAGSLVLAGVALLVVSVAQTGFGVRPGTLTDLVLQVTIVLAFVTIPLAVAVSVVRRGLFDVGATVARVTTYVVLTTLVLTGYLLLVTLAATLSWGRDVTSIVVTALVAVAVHPLHVCLRKLVNRALYGFGQNPAALLAGFATAPDPTTGIHESLRGVAEVIRRAARLPFVTVEVDSVASVTVGEVPGSWPVAQFALEHRGVQVGWVRVGVRDPDAPLTAADRRALDPVLAHLRLLAYAATRDQELRAAHREQVAGREEERRRLRNDLHDGVGPTLAAVRMSLAAAANHLDTDPGSTRRLVGEARQLTADLLVEVRRLGYGLRPPALDELGLVGALRSFVRGVEAGGMQVVVHEPGEELPELPAASEVAAYRIALEAITNALRHSTGSRCDVLTVVEAGRCRLEIRDDGYAELGQEGIGISSMRERASEVGGDFRVTTGPHGTVVTVDLPATTDRVVEPA
jgi:signal transduction histidine kinase